MSGTLTAADKLRHWRADPAAMVRELFGVAMLFISAAVVAERRGILEK